MSCRGLTNDVGTQILLCQNNSDRALIFKFHLLDIMITFMTPLNSMVYLAIKINLILIYIKMTVCFILYKIKRDYT